MTDTHTETDRAGELAALNARAADVMGWTRLEDPHLDYLRYPPASVTCPCDARPLSLPDFCGDSMAAGYLLGWLDWHGVEYNVHRLRAGQTWFQSPGATCRASLAVSWRYGGTAGEALARVIVAYWEENTVA